VSEQIETSKFNDEYFVRLGAIRTKMNHVWKKGRSKWERQVHDFTSCKFVILNLRNKTKGNYVCRSHDIPMHNNFFLDVMPYGLVHG
jgi:hypothetical protein